ncbi:MAG: glycoside hydrolase family 3 protein, partial [Lachnospiraceae bacterium]|nr:glycoside hydrolase family 3 protein [Lachnospiraceae bacterium]
MDLKTAIGQMIVMGFFGTKLDDETKKVMEECRIGNVILFSRNLTDIDQIAELTRDIRETVMKNTGYPAFISIDQEGGPVTRLPADIPQAPGAMAVASIGDIGLAQDVGLMTGEQLRLLGINLNFAPDADINSNPANPVIGVRSFGEDADTVIKYMVPEFKGMMKAGLAPCVKHFPGHGDTDVDSHLGLPTVNKSRPELEELELKPFRAAIAEGIPFIMTSHICFPKIDSEKPATLSHVFLTD